MKRFVILILVTLVLGGCANNLANRKDLAQIEEALAQNRLQLEQLRADLAVSQDSASKAYTQKLESLELRVKSIQDEQLYQKEARQKELSEQKDAVKTSTEPDPLLRQAQKDIQDLYRAVDLQNTGMNLKVAALEKEIKELKTALAGDKGAVVKQAEKATPAPSPAPTTASSTEPLDTVRQAYENARAEYTNGFYQKAIARFTQFVQDYPESEYCGNAYYWKGESYYAMSEWKQALKEFQTVTTNYINSWKEADAQLKIGMCYLNLKEHAKARAALNIIRRNFPQYGRMDLVNHYLNQLD